MRTFQFRNNSVNAPSQSKLNTLASIDKIFTSRIISQIQVLVEIVNFDLKPVDSTTPSDKCSNWTFGLNE